MGSAVQEAADLAAAADWGSGSEVPVWGWGAAVWAAQEAADWAARVVMGWVQAANRVSGK